MVINSERDFTSSSETFNTQPKIYWLQTTVQTTVKSSHLIEDWIQVTVETFCSENFTQSNFEGALNLKVEPETFKLQIIAEIKDLIYNEISAFKDFFLNFFVSKNSANQADNSEFHHSESCSYRKN